MADVLRRSARARPRIANCFAFPARCFRRVLSEFPGVAGKVRDAAAARARDLVNQLDALRGRLFEA